MKIEVQQVILSKVNPAVLFPKLLPPAIERIRRRHYWVASTEQSGRKGTGRTNKEAIGDLCLQLAREQSHGLTIEQLEPSPRAKLPAGK